MPATQLSRATFASPPPLPPLSYSDVFASLSKNVPVSHPHSRAIFFWQPPRLCVHLAQSASLSTTDHHPVAAATFSLPGQIPKARLAFVYYGRSHVQTACLNTRATEADSFPFRLGDEKKIKLPRALDRRRLKWIVASCLGCRIPNQRRTQDLSRGRKSWHVGDILSHIWQILQAFFCEANYLMQEA